MQIELELENAEAVQKAVRDLGEQGPPRLARALYAEAQEIMTKSRRLVPVDTGALRASGQVRTGHTGRDPYVEIVYGGPAAPYAIYVHERLDVNHTVGQAKFLEQPTLEQVRGMGDRLAAAIREG